MSSTRVTDASPELDPISALHEAGVKAGAYHAGLSHTQKNRVFERWQDGILQVVVATVSDCPMNDIDEQQHGDKPLIFNLSVITFCIITVHMTMLLLYVIDCFWNGRFQARCSIGCSRDDVKVSGGILSGCVAKGA